jgi:hypothetical protein
MNFMSSGCNGMPKLRNMTAWWCKLLQLHQCTEKQNLLGYHQIWLALQPTKNGSPNRFICWLERKICCVKKIGPLSQKPWVSECAGIHFSRSLPPSSCSGFQWASFGCCFHRLVGTQAVRRDESLRLSTLMLGCEAFNGSTIPRYGSVTDSLVGFGTVDVYLLIFGVPFLCCWKFRLMMVAFLLLNWSMSVSRISTSSCDRCHCVRMHSLSV